MKKPIWLQYLEYVPLRIILTLTKVLPYRLSIKIGRTIGLFVYYIAGGLRKTANEGIKTAFGDIYSKEKQRNIVRNSFKYLGQTTLEFIQLPKLKKNKKVIQLVDFGDSLNVMESLLKRGKGVIAISAHIGNWEIMTAATSLLGYDINVIVRLLDNPKLDKYVESFREMFGTKVIAKQDALKYGFKELKNNNVLAFLIDQNWAVGGVFVPFFGKLAATVTGPAFFAYKLGETPIMAAYTYRENGIHKVVFEEIPVIKVDDRDEFIKINTANFTKYYEDIVRKHPEQWLWVHPRWKKRPDTES